MMAFRLVGLAVAVGLCVVGLTACGGGGGSDVTDREIIIFLDPAGAEGTSGEASLSKTPDGTAIVVSVIIPSGGGEQPAGIYKGTCDNFEEKPAFELPTLQEGTNGTTLDVDTQELIDGGYVVVVHKSPDDPQPISCGAIQAE